MTRRILVVFLGLGLIGLAAWGGEGFTDNGDGTVTENETGLIWLQDASCLGEMSWDDAEGRVPQLASGECGLADESVAGQWRQPSKDDWNRLFAAAHEGGCSGPALTDDGGSGCASSGSSFQGVAEYYWSATPVEGREDKAWAAFTVDGGWDWTSKETERHVWAVRDGS